MILALNLRPFGGTVKTNNSTTTIKYAYLLIFVSFDHFTPNYAYSQTIDTIYGHRPILSGFIRTLIERVWWNEHTAAVNSYLDFR